MSSIVMLTEKKNEIDDKDPLSLLGKGIKVRMSKEYESQGMNKEQIQEELRRMGSNQKAVQIKEIEERIKKL